MNIPFLKSKDKDVLPLRTAEQMLSNVFAACDTEQNSVPLEALSSYSNYRKERYAIQRTVIALVLLLFILLPLLFFYGKIDVVLSNENSGQNPIYTVSVDTKIPLRQIQAKMDGRTVPIYEISENTFSVYPGGNGNMVIGVTLVNRQYSSVEMPVTTVDADAPYLVSTEVDDTCIHLYVSDAISGVNYAGIAASDADGNVFLPLGSRPDAGCVTFPYPDRTLNIRIPDLRGNVLQIELKPQKGP